MKNTETFITCDSTIFRAPALFDIFMNVAKQCQRKSIENTEFEQKFNKED